MSIIFSIYQAIKEFFEPTVPVENCANKELYYKDIMDGVSTEQRMKNLENGKYKLTENYPEPHRDPVSGKIVIENCKLYYDDIIKYGACKAQQWVKQGRYNLTQEEFDKEKERINNKYKRLYGV